MVFLIDLPRLGDAENIENVSSDSIPETSFQAELQRFLRAQNLDDSIIRSLVKYDFSETNRYRFVHTM